MTILRQSEQLLSIPSGGWKPNEAEGDMNKRFQEQIENFEEIAEKLLKFLHDCTQNKGLFTGNF